MTRVDRAWFQRLQLKHDEPLSNFAFNFNKRRYSAVVDHQTGQGHTALIRAAEVDAPEAIAQLRVLGAKLDFEADEGHTVGRYRLTQC